MANDEQLAADVLTRLDAVIEQRKSMAPDSSYVAGLYASGRDAILKKVGEEATEVVMAGKDDNPARIVAEVADLWFHALVLLHDAGSDSHAVINELARRFGTSGLVEKAARGGEHSGPVSGR